MGVEFGMRSQFLILVALVLVPLGGSSRAQDSVGPPGDTVADCDVPIMKWTGETWVCAETIGDLNLKPDIDPVESCPDNVFKHDGEKFVCVPVDRARYLMAMRDAHFDNYRACMSRFGVAQMIEQGKVKCRELGKVFDADNVECAGALPAKEEQK